MITASELADALGRKNIAEAVGVGPTAVSNAVVRESFPPAWYIAVSSLAVPLGVPCPPELFNMVIPSNTPFVDTRQRKQGGK